MSIKIKANPFKNTESVEFMHELSKIHFTAAFYISCNYNDQKQYDFQVAFQHNYVNK